MSSFGGLYEEFSRFLNNGGLAQRFESLKSDFISLYFNFFKTLNFHNFPDNLRNQTILQPPQTNMIVNYNLLFDFKVEDKENLLPCFILTKIHLREQHNKNIFQQ